MFVRKQLSPAVSRRIVCGNLGIICSTFFIPQAGLAEPNKLLALRPEVRIKQNHRFVASDEFKLGGQIGGRLLSAVGWNFARHFLPVLEENVPEASITAATLRYTACDQSLLEEIGGEDNICIPYLAYIHQLMADAGPSHVDGQSNFAYMRSPSNPRVWAIHWTVNRANEWNIGAVFVPHPDPAMDWRAGAKLFVPASIGTFS